MTTDSPAPTAAPYAVVDRPGPGLATITDRRNGTTGLWARSLRWKRVQQRLHGVPSACTNCGAEIRGGFYRPPPAAPAIKDLLCVACVEGGEAE